MATSSWSTRIYDKAWVPQMAGCTLSDVLLQAQAAGQMSPLMLPQAPNFLSFSIAAGHVCLHFTYVSIDQSAKLEDSRRPSLLCRALPRSIAKGRDELTTQDIQLVTSSPKVGGPAFFWSCHICQALCQWYVMRISSHSMIQGSHRFSLCRSPSEVAQVLPKAKCLWEACEILNLQSASVYQHWLERACGSWFQCSWSQIVESVCYRACIEVDCLKAFACKHVIPCKC